MQYLKRFRYATDLGTYIDLATNKAINESKLRTALEQTGEARSLADFESVLQNLQQVGMPRMQISQEYKRATRGGADKGESQTTLLNQAYQNLRTALKVHYHIKEETLMWFYVDSNCEVHPCSKDGVEGLELLIMRHPDLKQAIEAEFNKDEFAQLRATLSFEQFVRALYSRLKFDSDKHLQVEPPPISWDSSVPAYKQLNPALLQASPTPTWDQFTSRLDFPDHFRAFVWSIFEPRNRGRQALYLYGAGFDGKSSAFSAIANVLGDAHTMSIDNEKIKNTQFFFGNVYGKRLVLYPDCKVTNVLRHEIIKSLLGNDKVQVNRKNRDAFNSTVYVKLMIGSNRYPRIDSSDKSERTRLMFLKIKPIEDNRGDHTFESKLRAEMGPFLYQCRSAYEKLCPTHAEFQLPPQMEENIRLECNASDADALDDFMDAAIEMGPDYYATKNELKLKLREYLLAHELGQGAANSIEMLQTKLASQNVRPARLRLKSGRVHCIVGLRVKGTSNSIIKDSSDD